MRIIGAGAVIVCVLGGCSSEGSNTSTGREGASTLGARRSTLVGGNDYAATVLADSPVGYWRLGELGSAATALDATNSHNNGTYVGTPTLDTAGALVADRDGAPYFNYRNGDSVSVPHHANQTFTGNHFSLEAWCTIPIRPQTESGIITKTTSNTADGYGIFWRSVSRDYPRAGSISTPSLYFFVNNGNIRADVPFPVETAQARFHHVVGTYDGATIRLYVDGHLGGSNAYAATLSSGSAALKIAAGWSQAWQGKVDEVAIYASTLTDAQIQAHYQAGLAANTSDQVTSAQSPRYGGLITVATTASAALLATANNLKSWLDPISGTSFSVQPTDAPPAESIQLIRSQGYTAANSIETTLLADLNNRDLVAFAAVSDPALPGLKIISKSDAGLQAGAAFYLRVLGARWVLPNDHWKFKPARASIRWNVARVEAPELRWGSSFAPTGGYGITSLVPDPFKGQISQVQSAWLAWGSQNLLISGQANPGKQIGIDFNTRWALPQDPADSMNTGHPRWRAHDANDVPVPWASNGNFRWHTGADPDAQAFQAVFVADRVDGIGPKGGPPSLPPVPNSMAGRIATDPYSPVSMNVSAEEADGSTPDLAPGATAFGSPTDNMVALANAVANRVAAKYPGQNRYASMLAYADHAAVPSIALASNLIVSLAPSGFQRTGLSASDLVTAWGQKTQNLAIYDYWALPDWSRGKPVVDFFGGVPSQLRFWRANNANNLQLETTAGAGASGLALYSTGQLAWNTKILDDQLRQSMFDAAFGPDTGSSSAQAQIKAMLLRWSSGTTGFMLQSNELALSINNMSAALASAGDAAVSQRVVDYASYVHYLVLLYQWQTAGSEPSQLDAANALIKYMWQIHSRAMVQTDRIMRLMFDPKVKWNSPNNITTLSSRWSTVGGAGWGDISPTTLADSDITALLAQDQASYPVLFNPVYFSNTVVPLQAAAPPPPVTWNTPQQFFGPGVFALYPRQTGTVTIEVDYTDLPEAPVQYKVFAPDGSRVTTTTGGVQTTSLPNVQFQWQDITFNATTVGAYALEIDDQKAAHYVATPNNLPFAVTSGVLSDSQGNAYQYPNGNIKPIVKWFFYVPPGTDQFAIYGSQRTTGIPLNVYDPSGVCWRLPPSCSGPLIRCGSDSRNVIPASCSSDLLVIPTSGQSGIWALDDFKGVAGPLQLLNVPNLMSPTPEQVLKPSDL